MAEETSQATAPVQIPQNVRNLYNKALTALERKNVDIAIELFLKCVEAVPQYEAARRSLRMAEIAKFRRDHAKGAGMAHTIANLSGLGTKLKMKGLVAKGKGLDALLVGEQLMRIDPLNIGFAREYASAAVAAGIPEAGIMTLELIRENEPRNVDVLETLGILYKNNKRFKEAQECLSKAAVLKPSDGELAHMLKDVEALVTLNAGLEEANKTGDFRKAMADEAQAVQLQRKDKAVKTAADAESLIAEAREKISRDPKNINYYTNLGTLLVQQKRFEEAMQVYADARQIAPTDPELDRRYSAARVGKYDLDIAALREAGDENGAVAMETERAQYIFDDLYDRSQRYPNDLHIKYELGLQYFQNDYVDDAIQQFQLAQRNPKDRPQALYHLAVCFRKKGMPDMAAEQLDLAREIVTEMGPEKLQILYELGDVYQELGRLDEADKFYKEIFRYDMSYRDIAKKVEAIYAAKRAAAAKA